MEHWNNLSEHVIISGTVNTFKNHYDRFVENLLGLIFKSIMASFSHCHPGNSDGNTLNYVKFMHELLTLVSDGSYHLLVLLLLCSL